MINKPLKVAFLNRKIEIEYEHLEKGKFEDKELYKFITRAINDLKKCPSCATKIPKKLWPNEYTKEYSITNLWKYNMPNAWRLIYTIAEDEVMIISIILEWMTHKEYERRFNY